MRARVIGCAVAAAALVAACSSSKQKAQGPPSNSRSSATATGLPATYHPQIVPTAFSTSITNPYFPLLPGTKWIYDGTKDGVPEHVEVTVERTTKTIMGVTCVVISDIVTSKQSLVEKTTDWYAQDAHGNVWYFGEDSAEYLNGVVTSTQGTWEAGVDGAQPGIVMQASRQVGMSYRQEFRPAVAEDFAKIISVTDRQTVPAGTYRQVVVTEDRDPLTPDKIEHKWYASGVGMISAVRQGAQHTESIKLTKVVKS